MRMVERYYRSRIRPELIPPPVNWRGEIRESREGEE